MVDNAKRPFQWGTFDCGLWAADNFLALTNEDPAAAAFREKYTTQKGCLRAMRQFVKLKHVQNVNTLTAQVLVAIGHRYRVNVSHFPDLRRLRWGDPVCYEDPDGEMRLGAVDMTETMVNVVTDTGLGVLPKARVKFGLQIPGL